MKGFIEISKYAGMRPDLVQAGGGNTSVKLNDDIMLVKSSGFRLSDISENDGYTKVNLNLLKKELLENCLNNDAYDFDALLSNSIIEGKKPSIETFLHALTKKYTLHTHPTAINILMCASSYEEILKRIFSDIKYCVIPYVKPGMLLAKEILRLDKFSDNKVQIIFMQNHGLIVSSDDYSEVININEMLLKKVEEYLKLDYDKYHNVSDISKIISEKYIYLVDKKIDNLDDFIYEFCPDNIVYIGEKILKLNSLGELDENDEISNKSSANCLENIKTIYYNNYLYLIANNYKKAKEAEEIVLNTMEILKYIDKNKILKFDSAEILNIVNRKDEKYRQNL